jgi:hypothetical protein
VVPARNGEPYGEVDVPETTPLFPASRWARTKMALSAVSNAD